MLLLGISTKAVVGRLVSGRFSGRVGWWNELILYTCCETNLFCKACIVLTIELDHIGVVILGFVEKNIKR